MPIPYVVLFSSDAAGGLALSKTEAVLSEFPDLRLLSVTVESRTNIAGARRGLAALLPGGLPRRFIGIYAASHVDDLGGFLCLVAPNPLIFVPIPENPAAGLRLLKEAASRGAPTVALGEAGARNAALLAISMWAFGAGSDKLRKSLDAFRSSQTAAVRKMKLPAA